MSTPSPWPLSQRIDAVLEIDPGADALEFERRWYSWADLRRAAEDVATATGPAGGVGARVGVLLRNRPAQVGLALGVLWSGGCLVTVNPLLGRERVQRDLAGLGLAVIAGERRDVDDLVTSEVAARTSVLVLDELGGEAELTTPGGGPPAAEGSPGVAVQMLTSGTTGPPSRVDLSYQTLQRVMEGAKHYESDARTEATLRAGVVIVNSPMVHLGGLFRVVQAVCDGRRIVLLERFQVDTWIDAVRRYRPKTVSLVPAALRMVYDADLDPADFESVRSCVSGTAPLDPALAEAFTEKYGVPVLTSYAATEFGGGVAGWNLADYQKYAAAKRGSVGRAHPGCALRVVDEETGEELPPGEVGLLEVRTAQVDPDRWIRTTDLARLDEDGFLWIEGRADQAILRGGFKVHPETVRRALLRHPAVVDAVVVGIDDQRLGQVPVALVQVRSGAVVEVDDVLVAASEHLAPYEVPTDVRVVDALPRTPSQKVDLTAARALWASLAGAGDR